MTHAIIDPLVQRYTKGWAAEIHVQTQRGQAQVLLDRLLEFIDDRRVSIGARPSGRTVAARGETSEPAKEAAIKPAPEYYVSYARNDDNPGSPEREAFVDQLCIAARRASPSPATRPRCAMATASSCRTC